MNHISAESRLAALSALVRSQTPIPTRAAVADEIDAIRADLCASGPVRALEWRPSKTSYTQANCVLGQYQITFLGEFECWQLSAPHKQGTDWKDGFTRHASKSAAKAAAQADYERRILAALTPARQASCRKCCGTMQPGHALAQTCTSGAPDDLGGDAQTLSAGGPGALIDCRKCEDCGWSVTAAPQPEVATPTAQEAVPACKHLWGTHSRPGYDPLRPVVITCNDCGAVLSPDAHPPQPSVSVAEAGEDLVLAMRLFWEADEAADECRADGKDLEAARYDKMATGRWQSIPEKIDALDAALRALKGEDHAP